MGSRLQALLQQLDVKGITGKQSDYINKYIMKDCYSENKTGCCTMRSNCIACTVQKSGKHIECKVSPSADNYGGLKKGFLSNEKKNSNIQTEKKVTETQTEKKKCTETQTEPECSKGKTPHTKEPKTTDFSAQTLYDILPDDEEISVEDKILVSLGFLRKRIYSGEDFDQFLVDVLSQVIHLLANNHSNLPAVPTNRAPVFTDIIYLREHQFKELFKLYLDTAAELFDIPPCLIAARVLKNRELTMVTLYMYEYSMLFDTENAHEENMIKRRYIMHGYKAVIKRLDTVGYRDTVDKCVNLLEKFSRSSKGAEFKKLEQIFKCKKLELTVMIKALLKYQDVYKDNENRFYDLFCNHPIFAPITGLFDFVDLVMEGRKGS